MQAMTFRKKILLWGIIAGAAYTLMSYHFIFIGKKVRMLKKSEPTLNYTFFSLSGKTNAKILSIDQLHEDGVADLLVELGKMTEEEKQRFMSSYHE